MRAHAAFLYGWLAEIFSKAQPHFAATPTREFKIGICKLLAAHEYCNTYDLHDPAAAAARRFHDSLQEGTCADRRLVLSELMREGYGLGAASHTAQVATTAEAVGAAAGAASSWNSKASNLQNTETGNVVNMSRGQGNCTLGTPAQNIQACTPRERRISTLALAGHAVLCPDHTTGPKHHIFSEVVPHSLQDVFNIEDSALSPSRWPANNTSTQSPLWSCRTSRPSTPGNEVK